MTPLLPPLVKERDKVRETRSLFGVHLPDAAKQGLCSYFGQHGCL